MRSIMGSWRGGRSLGRLAVAAATVLAACGKGDSGSTPADPVLPGDPVGNPRFRAAAFVFDVNTAEKTVKVIAPDGGIVNASLRGGEGDGPNYSILAGDVVELTTSNYNASAVGAFTPGRIRVTFDVNITNRISAINLITPTFPTPPAGVTGVLLFPFEAANIVSTGGTTVGGDGTEIIVEQPSRGAVNPSVDFDGEPFNFFNDGGCAAGNNDDCYRYQTFATPLLGGATSESQTVGFDIDPTVYRFRARLIVAADIAPSGGAASGTITGSVTSNIGPLSGVSIAGTPGGLSATTDAAGGYTIASAPVGPRTLSVSGGLPAGCTLNAPTTVSVSVTNGGTATANFTATCPVPSFTISGSVTSNQGPLVGATVAASTGGSTTSAAGGAYSLSVPAAAGAGSLTISGIPAGCTLSSGDLTYPATAAGGTVTRSFVYACPVPGPNSVRGTWTVNAAAGTAQLRIGLTLTSGNLASFTQVFRIPAGSGLTYTGATTAGNVFLANGGLLSVTPATGGPTTIVVGAIVDPGITAITNQQVVILNFTYTGSGVVNFTTADGTPTNSAANFELQLADNQSLSSILSTFDNNVTIDALTRP